MNRAILLLLAGLLCSPGPAISWEEGDKDAYLEKLELMKGLVVGAGEKGETRQMCLAMSIGNDIAHRYLVLNPDDKEEQARLSQMRDQLTDCLGIMYLLTREGDKPK